MITISKTCRRYVICKSIINNDPTPNLSGVANRRRKNKMIWEICLEQRLRSGGKMYPICRLLVVSRIGDHYVISEREIMKNDQHYREVEIPRIALIDELEHLVDCGWHVTCTCRHSEEEEE